VFCNLGHGTEDVLTLLVEADLITELITWSDVFGRPTEFRNPELMIANAFFDHELAHIFDVAEVEGFVSWSEPLALLGLSWPHGFGWIG
jgi:hypothetical protein